MLKHVGKHNGKKIVLLYRKVPNEDHMCLVIYSDLLPRMYHDEIMKVLESASGQQAESFSDVLFRTILPDGQNCLEALHRNGMIKKVQTEQVVITPNTVSSVKLDELNLLLDQMTQGKDAVKRLAELDAEQSKKKRNTKTTGRELGEPAAMPSADSVLDDVTLARQRRQQAESMKADAARLLREAELLVEEANKLDPVNTNDKPAKKVRAKVKA
jgi:hypothetical protein